MLIKQQNTEQKYLITIDLKKRQCLFTSDLLCSLFVVVIVVEYSGYTLKYFVQMPFQVDFKLLLFSAHYFTVARLFCVVLVLQCMSMGFFLPVLSHARENVK